MPQLSKKVNMDVHSACMSVGKHREEGGVWMNIWMDVHTDIINILDEMRGLRASAPLGPMPKQEEKEDEDEADQRGTAENRKNFVFSLLQALN
jgi:hypothetical protein